MVAELEAKLAGIGVFIDRHNMWIDSAVHNNGDGFVFGLCLFLLLDWRMNKLKVIPSYRCGTAYNLG